MAGVAKPSLREDKVIWNRHNFFYHHSVQNYQAGQGREAYDSNSRSTDVPDVEVIRKEL